MDDRVVLDHLQGRHVIGVYPMLLDETCWFLGHSAHLTLNLSQRSGFRSFAQTGE